MAAKKKGGKGSWAGGKAPAQGGTPKKYSNPTNGVGKFTSKLKGQAKKTIKKGTSPLDGRKKGGK